MALADDLLRSPKENETFSCIYLFVLVDSHTFFSFSGFLYVNFVYSEDILQAPEQQLSFHVLTNIPWRSIMHLK